MRRIWATVAWGVASSVFGCLMLGLLGQPDGGASANMLASVVEGARAFGLPVVMISVFAAVSGAIIGDLPGLHRPFERMHPAWIEAQRDHAQFRIVREQFWLILAWSGALLLAGQVTQAPTWLWLFLAVFGAVRGAQLGRYLHIRRALQAGA